MCRAVERVAPATVRTAGAVPAEAFRSGVPGLTPEFLIQPSSGWEPLSLYELWEYRELLFFFTWRDITVRYKQSVFGVAWAIIQPVASMVVFTVIFGRLAGMPSDSNPYAIFTFAALLPWTLFTKALTGTSNSLVANQNMLRKIYFPRLLLPLSSMLAALVDFGIAMSVLFGLVAYFGISPTWRFLTLPLFVLFAFLAALSVGLWLAVLNVRYRDVTHVVPYLTQLWFYVSPVVYPTSLVPERWRTLFALNPMAGVIDGFRWAVLGHAAPPGLPMVVSVCVTLSLLVGGLYYFKSTERRFADLV